MLTVYKKVEKDTTYLTGIENKSEGLDCDRPFLFSIGENSQNNFELLQKSLVLARVHSKEDYSAQFRLDSFPADFLSFAYEDGEKDKEIVSELATKYFYPYLISKGISYEAIKKQAQKMNFLSFSTVGHKIFTDIENILTALLKKAGLTDDEVNEILSQISLVCIGASIKHYTNKVNTVYYVDVNDQKATNKTDYLKTRLSQEEQKNVFGGIGNNLLFIFDGSGQNNIENYFDKNGNCLGGLSYVISYFLDNSIAEKLPLSSNGICNAIKNGKERDNYSIGLLDKSLIYSGAKRHTEDSMKLRKELDSACEQIIAQPKTVDDTINFVLNEVRTRCTDTVYYQICAKLGLIANPSDEVMGRKTDRDIITGIQQMLGITPNTKNNSSKIKQKKEGE